MSQENVDAVRRFVDAYNRRDIEAMLEELDPEVEWHPAILALVEGEATVTGDTRACASGSETWTRFSTRSTSSTRRFATVATRLSGSARSACAAGGAGLDRVPHCVW